MLFESLKCPLHPHSTQNLLEDLSIRPLIRLTSDLDWLIPAPLIVHKLFIFDRVELRKGVALIVRGHVECRLCFSAAYNEGALNNRFVLDAVDRGAAEDIFTRSFQSSEETACNQSR